MMQMPNGSMRRRRLRYTTTGNREIPQRMAKKRKKHPPTRKTMGEYGTATMAMMRLKSAMIFTRASRRWMKLSRYADFSM
jgi:hypothetical protein